MSYPNQKIIQCIPEERRKGERFGSLSRKAEIVSARLLNDRTASHIVFLHFALHKNDYKFELSKQEVENQLGLSAKQYRKAISMLEKAGYLTKASPHSNIYYFKRIPDEYKDLDILDIISSDCADKMLLEGSGSVTSGENNISLQSKNSALEVHRNNSNKTDNTINNTVLVTNEELAFISPERKLDNTVLLDDNNHSIIFNDIESAEDIKYKELLKTVQRVNLIDGIIAEEILKKYLSTHQESSLYKSMGDKYGRIIKGWDEQAQEPIIHYSNRYLSTEEMRHNINGVPSSYYTNDTSAIKSKISTETKEFIGTDEEDEDDELPF